MFNARLHSKADIAALAACMENWGVTMPILIDETGNIIAGHARLEAAKLLKLKCMPVVVAKCWTEEQKGAYRIADNQLAARATWDFENLSQELRKLDSAGFELDLVGFDEATLKDLICPLGNTGLSDPDAENELPKNPVTKLGSVLRLGRHLVACGDCTDARIVRQVLQMAEQIRFALMVTDPPYGVNYDPGWRGKADGRKAGRAIGKVLNDDRADWREAWQLFPGNVAYVWHAGMFGGVVADSLKASGFEPRSQIVWAKSHFTLGRGDYKWQHECCLYAVRKNAQHLWRGGHNKSTLWEVPNNTALNRDRQKSWGHSTQKPVELMRRPIENNSARGDAVYDPFLGTGTTVIAAEMTGRTCVGLELSPAYVDVIVRRWMEFTGQDAIDETSGKTFQELGRGRDNH